MFGLHTMCVIRITIYARRQQVFFQYGQITLVKKCEDVLRSAYMKAKKDHEKVVRTSISMPPDLYEVGRERRKRGSFSSMSDYVQALIREDRKTGDRRSCFMSDLVERVTISLPNGLLKKGERAGRKN